MFTNDTKLLAIAILGHQHQNNACLASWQNVTTMHKLYF